MGRIGAETIKGGIPSTPRLDVIIGPVDAGWTDEGEEEEFKLVIGLNNCADDDDDKEELDTFGPCGGTNVAGKALAPVADDETAGCTLGIELEGNELKEYGLTG